MPILCTIVSQNGWYDKLQHLSVALSRIGLTDDSNSGRGRDAQLLHSFILNHNYLTSLEIKNGVGYNFDFPTILKRHGNNLKRLSIFEETCQFYFQGRHEIVISTLEAMKELS